METVSRLAWGLNFCSVITGVKRIILRQMICVFPKYLIKV